MKNGTCPKCGEDKVIQDVPIRANVMASHGEGQLMVSLTEPPDEHKWIQPVHTERFTFRAWICAACGYTELYLHKSEQFRLAWEKDWSVEER